MPPEINMKAQRANADAEENKEVTLALLESAPMHSVFQKTQSRIVLLDGARIRLTELCNSIIALRRRLPKILTQNIESFLSKSLSQLMFEAENMMHDLQSESEYCYQAMRSQVQQVIRQQRTVPESQHSEETKRAIDIRNPEYPVGSLPMPPDGYCAFHCMVAAKDIRRWVRTPRQEDGTAVRKGHIKRDQRRAIVLLN